jgi:hypothetical protein
MTTRVFIGTTEGPAEIQRITQEAPEIRSVVCLDGRAVALPISRDYESFVRRPSGIVERVWGGPAFRMDVGARITDGLSWQLAAFLAHGLHAAGTLATRDAPADTVVWATGEVDAALAVREVDEIPRKLELSESLLRDLAATRPWVMVPAPAAALAAAALDRLGLAPSCRLLAVGHAAEALAAIGLALPGAAPAPPSSLVALTPMPPERPAPAAPPRRRKRGRIAAAVAALILVPLAATAGWLAWDWNRTVTAWADQARTGDLIALDATLAAVAATPACFTCETVVRRFRGWLTDDRPTPSILTEETHRMPYGGCPPPGTAPPPPRAALQPHDGLAASTGACRVRYLVTGGPEVAIAVAGPAVRPAFGQSAGAQRDLTALGAGEASVSVDFPPLAIYASEQRVVALASHWPLDQVVPWLQPQLPAPPATVPDAVIARLAAMGVGTAVLRHRVDPERGF